MLLHFPSSHLTFVDFSASTFMVPFLHQFYAVVQKRNFLVIFRRICVKFGKILVSLFLFYFAETEPFSGAIWYEFSKQYQH